MSIELEKAGLNRFEKILTITNQEIISCLDKDKISTVINKIILSNQRTMPIISDKKELTGIITTVDVLDAFLRKDNFNESVSNIMVRDIISCNVNDSIGYALQKFKLSKHGCLPIIKEGKFLGLITERDFVKYFSNIFFDVKIKNTMVKKPFIIKPNITILDAIKSIVNTRYRRLPIVENKKLIGLITSIDLLEYIKKVKFEFSDLKHFISTIMIENIYSVTGDQDVSEAIRIMRTRNVGGLPVVNDSILEGIITERDILEQIV